MISADELAARIFELPTLPYFFEGGGLQRYVYLGGGNAELREKMCLNYVHRAAFLRLCELYSDGACEGAALENIPSVMKKLSEGCCRLKGVYTEKEQRDYLAGLSSEERERISELAKMYAFCLEAAKSRGKKPRSKKQEE